VNFTKCVSVNDPDCPCNTLADSIPNPRDREACTIQFVNSVATTPGTCLSYDAFRAACEDTTSCSEEPINTLQVAMIIYALVLVFMAMASCLGGSGTCYFRAWHPTEFFTRHFTRGENVLMTGAKSHRKCIQCLSLFHIVTLGFAFYAFSVVAEKCSTAENLQGGDFRMDDDTRNLLIVGLILVAGYTVLQTLCNCFCMVRGELLDAESDSGRECGDFCANCCCCKKYRARGFKEVRICKSLVFSLQEACFCSQHLKTLCYVVLRFICNLLFCLTCEPIGFLLESFWVNRHYIEP